MQSWNQGNGWPAGSGMWGGRLASQEPHISCSSHVRVISFRICSLTDSLCSSSPSPSPSLPLGKYSTGVVCSKYYYYYSSFVIPLIFQCDGARVVAAHRVAMVTHLTWLMSLIIIRSNLQQYFFVDPLLYLSYFMSSIQPSSRWWNFVNSSNLEITH